jgi:hypothetical protein
LLKKSECRFGQHSPQYKKKIEYSNPKQGAGMQNNNTRPVKMELKGEAGKRVLLAAARRIAKTHQKAIKALADK